MSSKPNKEINKKTAIRKKLFDLFSKDLKVIKEGLNISHNHIPEYLCPLCMEVFTLSQILPSKMNYLTLEDVPPKSLGGRPKVLTCKECNSSSGHIYDGSLHKFIKWLSFSNLAVNSSYKTILKVNGYDLTGFMKVTGDKQLSMNFDYKNMSPNEYELALSMQEYLKSKE